MAADARIDELFRAAVPLAATHVPRGPSFLEEYLGQGLIAAIAELAPDWSAMATGGGLVEVPGWDRRLGGFDVSIRRPGDAAPTVLVETKVDEVRETLWDLFKLASAFKIPGVVAAYLVVAAEKSQWAKRGDCAALFNPVKPKETWASRRMFDAWKRAWANLVGPRGGSARPVQVPDKVETAFIARASPTAFARHEIRCAAVRVPPDARILRFEGDWPAAERPDEG